MEIRVAECPCCNCEINIEEDMQKYDQITCWNCKAELEFVGGEDGDDDIFIEI